MTRRKLFGLLCIRWGFAVLVLAAIAVGVIAAATVSAPVDVPAIALQAVVIYRLEVGMAVFFGFYLAMLAFALALQNRGFTEIGTGGIRARELSEVSQHAAAEQVEMELISELKEEVSDLRSWREGMEYVR